MEDRKQKEIEFYDAQAFLASDEAGDFEGFNPLLLSSFRFCYQWLEQNCKGKKVLDFGCGNGIHTVFLAKHAREVVAIDLSESQLDIARERAKKEGIAQKIKFIKMDCERLEFPSDSFDIIFDGGTFSCLDLNQALPQLAKVLKSQGAVLGIETFGHNPITNFKRSLNKVSGKRTEWAASHIMKNSDFENAKVCFGKIQVKYFHLISWAAFPFLRIPGGKVLLGLLEKLDQVLLKFPGLKKFAFKAVFVFSNPKKYV